MRTEWTRRAFVASTTSATLVGLTGCQAPSASPSAPNGTAGEPPCTDTGTPARRPPTDDDHPLVREYPEFPDEVTGESAGDYATAFEEAYQLNRLAAETSARRYQVNSVYNRESTAVADGFVVAFEMELSWQEGSNGKTVSADATVAVTYFVSNRTAIRHAGSTDADPREDGVGEVVACRA